MAGQRRIRPSGTAWSQMMERLTGEHERHGQMPFHVLVIAGRESYVAATSVETRYRIYVRDLAEAIGFTPTPEQVEAITGARDFPDAYRRLARLGPVPPFAVVERALWATPSMALLDLRVAERRRRQVTAELAACVECPTALPYAA